ncbi:PIN domain-containing protein [Nibrella viscosa]|uniref:PIN domain-containing protein n=1 Tax=Nibrella viscosa TaxID=1084524 RepID=A0ABP8K204_9BACT
MTVQDLRQMAGVLIDANLLVLYAVGLYDRKRIEQYKRTRNYAPADFDLLIRFISFFPKAVTTPNILSEASNLLEGTTYQCGPLLSYFPQQIQVLEEVYLPSYQTMVTNQPVFTKFGLSDTVSYELAKRQYLVLTDDLDFCYYLQGNNLPALNFNNLRTNYLLGS